MMCRHCGIRKPTRGRGLCRVCHEQHKDSYAKLPTHTGDRGVKPRCIGCDREAPHNRLSIIGWHSRRVVVFGVPIKESHCPECYAAHGWGDLIPAAGTIEGLHHIEQGGEPEPRVFRFCGGNRPSWSMGLSTI